jgi:hypothetical protein
MRMRALIVGVLAVAAVTTAALLRAAAPDDGTASSHREAPLIAEDPTADTTDLYAFRSPDKPDTLTIIGNWIPGEDPAAGPNYYTFSTWPKARYNIKIDRTGDGRADITYRFQFREGKPVAFLGGTAQPFVVLKIQGRKQEVVARGTTPPNNIGPRSTDNYRQLAAKGVVELQGGGQVFAGQRDDAFFGDIGAIFDLVAIRKEGTTGDKGGGKDFFAGYAVHTIALQIPISQLDNRSHVIGVWATTDRRTVTVRNGRAETGFVQVSRLGNPLVNEVIIPTQLKDRWNRLDPAAEGQFARYYREPILAGLLNQLYKLGVKTEARDDLVQVLLTGVPKLNFTGSRLADMLRVNLSTPVTPAGKRSRLGVLGGDTQGWPNGRRLEDDVIDIAERAVAGALIGENVPLGDGVDANDVANMDTFPYQADPQSGFANTKSK